MSSNLKKYGARKNEEYGNRRSFPGGRSWSASRGGFRRRNDYHTKVDMFQGPNDPQGRRPPYGSQQKRWRSNWQNGDQLDNTTGKDRQPGDEAMQQDMVKGAIQDWFLVKIPCGRRFDKTWLMNSIQSYCSVPFTPVDFHYDRSWAQFFIEGANVADALREICYKICGEKGQKVSIFVGPSCVPYSVRYKFTDEQIEQIKLTMKKRYNVEEQALDLQKLRFDPDLVDHDIDFFLNRRHCLSIAVQIIQENFPELAYLNLSNNKLYRLDALSDIIHYCPDIRFLDLSRNQLRSVLELNKVKGLKLDELWLEGNPLCGTFPDQSSYQRAVHTYFPQLLWLDGQQFDPPAGPGAEGHWLMNPRRQGDEEDEGLRERILQFLKEYYSVFDSGNRHDLLGAYHDEACFSVYVPASASDLGSSCLIEYFKHNQNLNTLKDPYVQRKLLKQKKHDIVDALCLLPKTQHDLGSFIVGMCFQTGKMICFSVNGLFREEAGGNSQNSVRAFTRTFVAVPGSGTSLCIMNDQLFVRDTTSEVSGTFTSHVGPDPRPTLSPVQCEMVQSFSIQSGMKLDWSEKCLMDNAWDYNRAAQIFVKFQNEGKIPQEAFKPKS